MPKFTYEAVARDGTQVTGEDEASSLAALGTALLEKDLALQGAKEKKSALQSVMQFEITRKKVPTKELMHFSRQLAAFLKAGVSILDAVEVIQEEMTNKVFRAALDDIVESVRAGTTFSGAARAHPEVFPPVYLGMLESAEMTGNLDSVLDQLSGYLERDLEARRKVMSALLYPGIVAGMSVATVGILAGFVLPRFKDFFNSLDAKLPDLDGYLPPHARVAEVRLLAVDPEFRRGAVEDAAALAAAGVAEQAMRDISAVARPKEQS